MMPATCTRHAWQTPDGETFSYSLWDGMSRHGRQPRAVMIGVHGLSGAALDYEPLARHLAPHEVVTVALELRGQGNDPRPKWRGDLARIEDWYADLNAFFALVRERFPGAPLFYYGESMGAALLTRFLAQGATVDQPAGLVLASPVVAIPGKPSWWQRQVFRFFLWARPRHRVDVRKFKPKKGEAPKWVTRDEAHRAWFETAEHKIDLYTIRFFKCLFDLISGCFEAAPRVRVPVLVIYAANDVFIPPPKVEAFFAELGSAEKELHFFPAAYHLLLHDDDKERALARIEAWLLGRLESIEFTSPKKDDSA